MVRLHQKLDPTKTGDCAKNLEKDLRKMIVGQNEAVEQIINIYQMYLTGMNVLGRPIGTFLFLGPTGTGKTRTVEATAECLVKNPQAVIKIDCGEFQHSHEIAKLIGSPPGYLGHRETHPLLSQEVLNQYHTDKCKISFVLFDEIEKASDAVWNLLLGILDKGTLTLGNNRKVDFSRAMIFMTSNVGSKEMSAVFTPTIGFHTPHPEEGPNDPVVDKTNGKIARSGINAARRKFPPEFVNRVDKIVVFNHLGPNQLRHVLDIELEMVQQRLFDSAGQNAFMFNCTDRAKDFLLQEGADMKYGARPLKRIIEKLLVHPMANLIATDQTHGGDMVHIDLEVGANCLAFTKVGEGLQLPELKMQASLYNINVLAAAVGMSLPEETSPASEEMTKNFSLGVGEREKIPLTQIEGQVTEWINDSRIFFVMTEKGKYSVNFASVTENLTDVLESKMVVLDLIDNKVVRVRIKQK